MKKHFTKFSMCLIIIFILTIICAITFALLSYQHVITYDINIIVMTIISMILFLLLGIIFGGIVKKRGLLIGIGLSLLYLLGVSLYLVVGHKVWDWQTCLRIGARMLALIIGSILGVNLSMRKS